MTQEEIQQLFEETLKGKNIMTPNIIEFGEVGDNYNLVYELSEGTGFSGEPVFGVTVLEVLDDGTVKRRSDKSKLCFSLEEAQEALS